MSLKGENQRLTITGTDKYFVTHSLEIDGQSRPTTVSLKKLMIWDGVWRNHHITNLIADDVRLHNGKGDLNGKNIELSQIRSFADEISIVGESIKINRFIMPRGKLHINPYAYFEIKADEYNYFEALELNVNAPKNYPKPQILLTNIRYKIDRVNINAFCEVVFLGGELVGREINVSNVKSLTLPTSYIQTMTYKTSEGQLHTGGTIIMEKLFLLGAIKSYFSHATTITHLEGLGLCSLMIHDAFNSQTVQLNLDMEISKPPLLIEKYKNVLGISIFNDKRKEVKITSLFGKFNLFEIRGKAEIGNVLFQPLPAYATMIWIHKEYNPRVLINKIFVSFDHEITVDLEGKIHVIRNQNMLSGEDMFATVNNIKLKDHQLQCCDCNNAW